MLNNSYNYNLIDLTFKNLSQFSRSAVNFLPQQMPEPAAQWVKLMDSGLRTLDFMVARSDKPEWNLDAVHIAGRDHQVTVENVYQGAFADLLHFHVEGAPERPKVLLVAPMSGHYATLLRPTVQSLLAGADVYITDWANARDVPLSEGTFGIDLYVEYLQTFFSKIGKGTAVMAVCQPAPLVLATVALMEQHKHPYTPSCMILMGGPIDTQAADTEVTRYGRSMNVDMMRGMLISEVSSGYAGAGREVYAGSTQLAAFISMNSGRHSSAFMDYFFNCWQENTQAVARQHRFYDEYLSVSDLDARFYLETLDMVFRRNALAKGTFKVGEQTVDLDAVNSVHLLTIEGENDDISAPGQTYAANRLLRNLSDDKKAHWLEAGVGHYGIFAGRAWRQSIAPRIIDFVTQVADAK